MCRDHPAGLAPLGMVPPHSVDPSTLGGISPYVTRLPQVLLQYHGGSGRALVSSGGGVLAGRRRRVAAVTLVGAEGGRDPLQHRSDIRNLHAGTMAAVISEATTV